MKANRLLAYLLVLVTVSFLGLTFLGQKNGKKDPKSVSIEGTYRLVSRSLANGMTVKPPVIVGLFTYTKFYRNFNVMWVDSSGKRTSLSVVSKYKLTDKEYTETLLYSALNDETGLLSKNKGMTYTTNETKTVPVTIEGSKITFSPPFDAPTLTFEGNKMSATAKGKFTDHWEKVK